MNNEMIDDARAALGSIPVFDGIDPQSAVIQKLGGLTNLVFRVSGGNNEWCLRLPGKGTEEYIDRANEAQAASEMHRIRSTRPKGQTWYSRPPEQTNSNSPFLRRASVGQPW